MKVFISWSGEASRQIATKLYEWLPMVVQTVQPYMSAESIEKGTRWASSIAGELEGTSVGIVVLTPDNLTAPWIYFESGALAKVVGDSKLAPLLCGLKPSDIGSPLSQFQVTLFNKDDVLRLLKSINASADGDALPDSRLERMHNVLWDDLEKEVTPLIPAHAPKQASPRVSENETQKILEELLLLTRQQAQAILNPEKLISRDAIQSLFEDWPERLSSDDAKLLRMISNAANGRVEKLQELLAVGIDTEESKAEAARIAHDLQKRILPDLERMAERIRFGRTKWGGEVRRHSMAVPGMVVPKVDRG